MKHNMGSTSSMGKGKKAVVIGGSISGMLTAQVLTKYFERVVIIERDLLKTTDQKFGQRPGVPQSVHSHGLLMRGLQILEQLFPGITTELAESGAPIINWTADLAWLGVNGWSPRFNSDLTTPICSRNLLESTIRKRSITNERIEFKLGTQVNSLVYNTDQTNVTGVKVRTGEDEETEIRADLIVDASGRNSRTPEWLKVMGYGSPQETIVNSFLGYSSRWYEIPNNWYSDCQNVLMPPQPPDTRGGVIYQVEGNRWIVTLIGIGRDYPPTDEAGFLEFARSLRSPIIYETIKNAQPISGIYAYKRTENCLRHYGKLSRFPDNLVVVGDAVCSFNPVYGQGMTIAALGAATLDQCLSQKGNLIGLSQHFQQQLSRVITLPWMMATGEDFRWPTTQGGQPSFINKMLQGYLDQLMVLQSKSKEVHQTFFEVVHMIKPPTAFFHPKILIQVLQQVFSSPSLAKNLNQAESLP
jgi:2-polyprenyl-6-methoxyphenol hydroxylase-like FAD-dependent oxidoreductase